MPLILIPLLLILSATCSILFLPTVISPDSQEYLHFGQLIGTGEFWKVLPWYRTPLYPLQLRISTALFGVTPGGVAIGNILLSTAAVGVMSWALARISKPAGVAACVLLLLFPTRVAYEHTALTESGTFFILALSWSMLLNPPRSYLRASLYSSLLFATGYYYRSNTILLMPIHAVLLAYRYGCRSEKSPLLSAKSGLVLFLGICLGTTLLVLPWSCISRAPDEPGRHLAFGLLKQGVVDAEYLSHPVLRAEYLAAKKRAEDRYPWMLDGLTEAEVRAIVYRITREERARISGYLSQPEHWSPYLKGVARAFISHLGLAQFDGENELYRETALGGMHPLVRTLYLDSDPVPVDHPDWRVETSFYGRTLFALGPLFEWLVALGSLASIALIATRFFPQGAIALLFIGSYALTLLSTDRYIFPSQPLLIANLVLLCVLILRCARR